jgi:cytochrome P450
MSTKILGQTFIIINDIDLAYSLFSQEGAIYADRPSSVMLELANLNCVIATRPFGQEYVFNLNNNNIIITYRRRHKKGRQIMSSLMRLDAFKKFHPIIDYHALRLIRRLAKQNPGDYATLIVRTASHFEPNT